MRRQLHVQFIFKHPTKLGASSKLSIEERSAIAKGER